MIHLDSSFLIDLQREIKRERLGGAFDFIEAVDAAEILAISVHVVCEMTLGAELSREPLKELKALDEFLGGLLITYPDARFAPLYARLLAAIHRGSRKMETMDLLIATAALMDDAPLVTRNVKDFSRVPGLRVLSY